MNCKETQETVLRKENIREKSKSGKLKRNGTKYKINDNIAGEKKKDVEDGGTIMPIKETEVILLEPLQSTRASPLLLNSQAEDERYITYLSSCSIYTKRM